MKNVIYFVLLSILFIGCESKQQAADEVANTTNDSIRIVNKDEVESTLIKAPEFSLPDINGKQVSLADYKGKLIYMDIWATWCGPCLMQLPSLQQFEEKYRGENIVFLSISTDPDADKSKWKVMVENRQMKGEQLFAGHASGFAEAYEVDYIPRFLLISPQGEILMDNAPEPMDFATRETNKALEDIFDLYIKANKKASQ